MLKLLSFTLLFLVILTGNAQEQNLIAKDAVVIKVATGYKFTEGPSVARDGRVFFTDQPNDKILIWNEKDNSVSTFLESTERSNGTYFNKKGELVSCADLNNRLIVFSMDKKMRVLAENFEGKHLNGPNDLWINPKNGGIYFSDPYWPRDYWEKGHSEVQDTRAVYYLYPDGKVIRVIADFKSPNGLVGTPDGKTLYASDMGDRKIWKYDILADGTLGNKTLFAPEGADGMTIDNLGNIYLANRGISVYAPDGKSITKIKVPESITNLCFGGKKRNILFITSGTSAYTLKMNVKGVN
jgi:gluconolactonase